MAYFFIRIESHRGLMLSGTLKRGLAPPYGYTVTAIVILARCRALHCARKGGEGLKNYDFLLSLPGEMARRQQIPVVVPIFLQPASSND